MSEDTSHSKTFEELLDEARILEPKVRVALEAGMPKSADAMSMALALMAVASDIFAWHARRHPQQKKQLLQLVEANNLAMRMEIKEAAE